MRNISLTFLIALTIIIVGFTVKTPPLKGTLTFFAGNFSDHSGEAIVQIFRKNDDVPKTPYKQSMGKIKNGKAVIVFEELPYGEYAAILVHDKNQNYKVDHKFGFPSEPLGFTNNWRMTVLSGIPSFEKLKFMFSIKTFTFSINIQE